MCIKFSDGLHPFVYVALSGLSTLMTLVIGWVAPSMGFTHLSCMSPFQRAVYPDGVCHPMGYTHRSCMSPFQGFLRRLRPGWASSSMGCTLDGLHPSLVYVALSGLSVMGCSLDGLHPRWASPIVSVYRPFRAVYPDGVCHPMGYTHRSCMSPFQGSGERLSSSLSPERASYVSIGCSPMFYDTTGAKP